MDFKSAYQDSDVAQEYMARRFEAAGGAWLSERELDIMIAMLEEVDTREPLLEIGSGTGRLSKIDDNKVTDIKFDGKGCAICMACSSVLTEITKGKSLDDVRKIQKNDILGELGLEHLQAVRIKCALLSLKVLKSALYTYLAKHLDDSQDVDSLKEDAANLY